MYSRKIIKFAKKAIPVLLCIYILLIIFDLLKNKHTDIAAEDTDVPVPEEIQEFVEKYPEAAEYAENYAKYADKDLDDDVKKEMKKSSIPLFIQWDKKWGYRSYGEGYVGTSGCGPTCLAMVACGLKQDDSITPKSVCEYADENGFYVSGQGTSWSLMTTGAEHYGLSSSQGEISERYILDNLSEKTPMICSMKPGDFTTSGHFIVLTGIDDNGKVIVNDSNSRKNSDKHWDAKDLVSQMKGIWVFSLK